MSNRRAIVWFRQDLRLHDNEALTQALRTHDEIIPVYIFDERQFFGSTTGGFAKTGRYRARFILESVQALRTRFRELGLDLYIRIGKPELIIAGLAQQVKSHCVYCNRERTAEESYVQNELERRLWALGQEMRFFRGKMLLYTADLPFPVAQTPDSFTQFRKEVEHVVHIRQPLPAPEEALPQPDITLDYGDMPSLRELGHEDFDADPRSVFLLQGGEAAGLDRLRYYLWTSGAVRTYKDSRDRFLDPDHSSKFSAYLAQGCLSPKLIYHEIRKYEAEIGANESTYCLIFELFWRDFYRFMAKKHGSKIFQPSGIGGVPVPGLTDDMAALQAWTEGRTGVPFVDAHMLELKATGFMSSRGRLNVASYLVRDLKVNWQLGAEYFESMLVDYDPCSNWGNWNHVAGAGLEQRQERGMGVLSQARRFDPDGTFVKTWLPELTLVPEQYIHQPEQMPASVLAGATLDYPRPLVQDAGCCN